MATTTTNFGWDIPQSTDLVKDGATAIAALGQDIDTALVDLKGGTTGQVLAKASNTDLDFSWVAPGGGLTWTLLNTGGTALNTTQEITVSGLSAKQMLIFVKDASSANVQSVIEIRPNNDTTAANYASFGSENTNNDPYSVGQSKPISSDFGSGFNRFRIGRMENQVAGTVSGSLFIDSTDTTNWKRVSVVGNGSNSGGTGQSDFTYQGLFKSTSAITSITIRSSSGNFDAGTIFIYGAN